MWTEERKISVDIFCLCSLVSLSVYVFFFVHRLLFLFCLPAFVHVLQVASPEGREATERAAVNKDVGGGAESEEEEDLLAL